MRYTRLSFVLAKAIWTLDSPYRRIEADLEPPLTATGHHLMLTSVAATSIAGGELCRVCGRRLYGHAITLNLHHAWNQEVDRTTSRFFGPVQRWYLHSASCITSAHAKARLLAKPGHKWYGQDRRSPDPPLIHVI